MPTSRHKLTLDEQSFQDMLAAAFTIQEHNALRRKNQAPPERVCGQCGAAVAEDASLCQKCTEATRPGEDLQRKWASLWLMSQEQGLGPESFSSLPAESFSSLPEERAAQTIVADEIPAQYFPETIEIPLGARESADSLAVETEAARDESSLAVASGFAGLAELKAEADSSALETVDEAASVGNLRDWRVKLRFHRADFYLVAAIAVSTFAMVWVLSATPVGGTHHKPRLRPWERALVSLGLAEAPEPPPRRGNPNISVWEDPKTALYYCVGEELYGKAPGGHLATQREAQLDQFEPAGRVACE